MLSADTLRMMEEDAEYGCFEDDGMEVCMEKLPFILRENPDGSIEVNYEDLGVEMFGREDYEVNYIIDEANTKKLKTKLEEKHTGDLKEMLVKEFGECLDKKSFAATCLEWKVDYQLFTF